MPKPTNVEFRPRRSRWFRDEHAKDEQRLALYFTLFIGAMVVAIVLAVYRGVI